MALGNPFTWFDENVLGGQAPMSDAQRKAIIAKQPVLLDSDPGGLTPARSGPGVGPTSTVPVTTPTMSFAPWAMGFVVVAVVLLASQESENWAPVGSAFAWLIAGTMVVTKWNDIQSGYHQIVTL